MPYTDNPVSRKFWTDRKVKQFSRDGRDLALYTLTCEARSPEGFYAWRQSSAKEDLRFTDKALSAAMSELEGAGFAYFDRQAEVVFVAKALKHVRPIRGSHSVKGALQDVQLVQDAPELFARFWQAAEKYQSEFFTGLRDRYPNYSPQLNSTHGGALQAPSEAPSDLALESQKQQVREGGVRNEVRDLSQLLADLILKRDPKARVDPASKGWLDAIRLLIDSDGRSAAEVDHVIRWCQRDQFWQKNILSAPKLRKQFDALYAKAGRPPAELSADFDKDMNIT